MIADHFNLIDKVAIVTGSGQGIGEAVALALVVAQAAARFGRIDILVNNAGSGGFRVPDL